jgi:hypothetical protein
MRDALDWIWPPALLTIVIRARRRLPGQTRRRLLLYPVLAMLALASIDGDVQPSRPKRGVRSGGIGFA